MELQLIKMFISQHEPLTIIFGNVFEANLLGIYLIHAITLIC